MSEELAIPISYWIRLNSRNRDIIEAATEKHRLILHYGGHIKVGLYGKGDSERKYKMVIRRKPHSYE